MEEFHSQPKFNKAIAFLDVAIVFVFAFSIVGFIALDSIQRSTARIVNNTEEQVHISVENADFDPGVRYSGSIDAIPTEKINSLFDNIKQ